MAPPYDLYKPFDVKFCFYVLHLGTTLPGYQQTKHLTSLLC